jgi:hypothetical protein
MVRAFQTAAAERRAKGAGVFVGFVLSEWTSLAVGAVAEWIAKLKTDAAVRGRSMPDLRFMRPVGVERDAWFAGADLGRVDAVAAAQRRVDGLISRMVEAIAKHDFATARSCSLEERQARAELQSLLEERQAA